MRPPRIISPKNTVSVSRYWDQPTIWTSVTVDGISLTIAIEDYLTAVAQELGPTLSVTRASLASKLITAGDKVRRKIQEESVKAI